MERESRTFWNDEFFPRFRNMAYRFGETPECPYPFYEVRRQHVLDALSDVPPGRVLDVGCGGAHVIEALVERGWTGAACDFAPNMVAFARSRLAAGGISGIGVDECAATDLSRYDDAEFDAILILGPIEYLSAQESESAYGEARRVLRADGLLLCAHINMLFDLFTCDAFTAAVDRQMLVDAIGYDSDEAERIEQLLVERLCGTAGEGHSNSIRHSVGTRADNPLTIAETLAGAGFRLMDMLFYRFYAAPPFVLRADPSLGARSIPVEQTLCRDWRGHFLASSFLTVSRRVSN